MYSLVFPDISHKQAYIDMIQEWWEFETIPTSPGNLFFEDTYELFLWRCESWLFFGPESVLSNFYFFMKNETILWALDLRHHINHPNLSLDEWCGGHIGYGLRPSARGKWLAKVMLQLGLDETRKIELKQVIVSAHEDNPASWKTIEGCWGVLLKIVQKEWKNLKVYTIQEM